MDMRDTKTSANDTEPRIEDHRPDAVFADPVAYLKSLGLNAELVETASATLSRAA